MEGEGRSENGMIKRKGGGCAEYEDERSEGLAEEERSMARIIGVQRGCCQKYDVYKKE